MGWATLAISLVALSVSILAIVDARKALGYTVKKEAAEKRAHLLKLVGQIERKLQEGKNHAKQVERFWQGKSGYITRKEAIDSLAADLDACKGRIDRAPTVIELAGIEEVLNGIEPKVNDAVAQMNHLGPPHPPIRVTEVPI